MFASLQIHCWGNNGFIEENKEAKSGFHLGGDSHSCDTHHFEMRYFSSSFPSETKCQQFYPQTLPQARSWSLLAPPGEWLGLGEERDVYSGWAAYSWRNTQSPPQTHALTHGSSHSNRWCHPQASSTLMTAEALNWLIDIVLVILQPTETVLTVNAPDADARHTRPEGGDRRTDGWRAASRPAETASINTISSTMSTLWSLIKQDDNTTYRRPPGRA